MAAPQTENMNSPLHNLQHQRFLWNNSALGHTMESQEKELFTKLWTARSNTTSLGTYSLASGTSLPFWRQRDKFIHTDDLGMAPSVSATALLSLNEKDLQNKRNILLTDIPIANYLAIMGFINCFKDIKDIFEKTTSAGVTVAIVFYDIQQALHCHSSLNTLLQKEPELYQVGLMLINNSMVASYFGVSLGALQDTHLLVSMYGPFSQLVVLDYMKILDVIEPVHYLKELEMTDSQLSLIVEYSDTRTALATQNLIHGKLYKGVIFNACLCKPSDEPRRLLSIKQSTNDLQPILENDVACECPGSIRHYSRFDGTPGNLENKNRVMKDLWTIDIPPRLASPHPHPSVSTSSFSSSSSSESSLTPPSPSTPSPTYSTLTGYSLLRHGSSSAKHHHHHHHHHHHRKKKLQQLPPQQQQQQQQQQFGSQSVEVPQELSAHLLGTLIHELSPTSLDFIMIMTPQRNDHAQEANDFILDNVIHGLDRRTTFMIRNIPNKYDQGMLMEWINVSHKGTYDFLYLRIDFKNGCNVGYAFINFIEVDSVISFAQERNGKQWNHFNSQKVCQLAYAKIQGKQNLIKKFRNSCVMDQEASFRPKIFYSSGIHQGEEEPFPSPTSSDNKNTNKN